MPTKDVSSHCSSWIRIWCQRWTSNKDQPVVEKDAQYTSDFSGTLQLPASKSNHEWQQMKCNPEGRITARAFPIIGLITKWICHFISYCILNKLAKDKNSNVFQFLYISLFHWFVAIGLEILWVLSKFSLPSPSSILSGLDHKHNMNHLKKSQIDILK